MIYTIGHSTRSIEELLALLEPYGITTLADIRRHPSSRWHPQFNAGRLAASLATVRIDYVHMEALGGRRKPALDSPNAHIKDEQLRGYADYMASPAFANAVDELLALPPTLVVMCSEGNPSNCHRSMLADALVERGESVQHIIDASTVAAHTAGFRHGGSTRFR